MTNDGDLSSAQVGYLELVGKNTNYRSLWIGEIISLFGDWFNLIASAALISSLTASGLAVGGLFVVRMLAPFLVSPLAGVVADRYNRKRLLILADITRGLVVLGFLFVREPGHVWVLYTLTAVQLGISGFFYPGRNAILPEIVSGGELGAANALSSATWSVMLALGAALGGVVAGGWGIYPAFVIDSLTFFLSALFISRIVYQGSDGKVVRGTSIRAVNTQCIEGIRYLAKNRDILAIALHKGAVALSVNGAFQVIQVTLAENVFVIGKGGGTSLGLMYAVAGVGTGLGPIIMRRFTGDRAKALRTALAAAYAITVVGLLVVAPLKSFESVLFGSFIRAFGTGISWVFSTQLLLQLVPGHIRGRVFSTEFALFTLANAVGAAAGGWILDNTAINVSELVFLTSILTLIPGIWWGLLTISRSQQPVSVKID